MDYIERTMKSDKIYDGKIVKLRIDTVELPNKKYSKREIVEHSPAVAIVAVTQEDELLLVKQYRKPIEKMIYEIPAGMVELKEKPKDAAVRELREETGYTTDKIEYMTEFYTSPGFCDEKIHAFYTEDIEIDSQNLDEDEFLYCVKVPYDDVVKMIMRGEITDAKTIAAVLFYDGIRRKIHA
ncbi:MAG: NUDIX hydrolase [Peptoniphilus sp.]|nr:NUDIX hydrolase [Peptoniphilus sp.]